ncbi:MAG: hypothetical protein GXY47_13855 [Acidobacteria bacterium]|nr:hypothetical protein [Acidobacteriota bacterium]
MARKGIKKDAPLVCPLSGKACINCALYRGRHFNLCFQDHHRGDDQKGTGPLKSMGFPAAARIVKCDQCETGYWVLDS